MKIELIRTAITVTIGVFIGTLVQGRSQGKSVKETLSEKKFHILQIVVSTVVIVAIIEYFFRG